jgi:hypothetical protein
MTQNTHKVLNNEKAHEPNNIPEHATIRQRPKQIIHLE